MQNEEAKAFIGLVRNAPIDAVRLVEHDPVEADNVHAVLRPEIAAADPGQDADPARRQQAQRTEHGVIQIARVRAEPEHAVQRLIVDALTLDRGLGIVRPAHTKTLEGVTQTMKAGCGMDDGAHDLHVSILHRLQRDGLVATILLVLRDRSGNAHREQFCGLIAFLRELQRQVLQLVDIILQVDRHVRIEGPVAHQGLEHMGAPACRADRAVGRATVLADRDVFVLDLAEERRRPDGLGLGGKWGGWIGLHDATIHHFRNSRVDRGGLVDRCALLQKRELPIGDLRQLADGFRQGFADLGQPFAGAPAIPNVLAEQVGARSHGGVA